MRMPQITDGAAGYLLRQQEIRHLVEIDTLAAELEVALPKRSPQQRTLLWRMQKNPSPFFCEGCNLHDKREGNAMRDHLYAARCVLRCPCRAPAPLIRMETSRAPLLLRDACKNAMTAAYS